MVQTSATPIKLAHYSFLIYSIFPYGLKILWYMIESQHGLRSILYCINLIRSCSFPSNVYHLYHLHAYCYPVFVIVLYLTPHDSKYEAYRDYLKKYFDYFSRTSRFLCAFR